MLNGHARPGDTMAIVGAGPIGLATLLTARLFSPAQVVLVDVDDQRLAVARELGATHTVNSKAEDAIAALMKLTDGVGVDVAVEAVGVPETFDLCQQVVAPGGHVANIGVHGKPATLRLDKLWDRNVTLTTRLVDTAATPMLLRAVVAGSIQPQRLITHRFAMGQMAEAYDTFGHAARERPLKVVIAGDA